MTSFADPGATAPPPSASMPLRRTSSIAIPRPHVPPPSPPPPSASSPARLREGIGRIPSVRRALLISAATRLRSLVRSEIHRLAPRPPSLRRHIIPADKGLISGKLVNKYKDYEE